MNEPVFPLFPETEQEGRMVVNALGTEENVVMPKGWWDYFDWCEAQGWDMKEWVRQLDVMRPVDMTLSEHIWGSLWKLECSRYKQGLSDPSAASPDGYDEFLEAVRSGECSELFPRDHPGQEPNRDECLPRVVKNASGNDEVISLPLKHWKHFDWLAMQGVDMDEWLKKCDLGKADYDGFRLSFSGHAEMLLVQSEERLHNKGVDVPLFIKPDRNG